jgi:hypothetical protein
LEKYFGENKNQMAQPPTYEAEYEMVSPPPLAIDSMVSIYKEARSHVCGQYIKRHAHILAQFQSAKAEIEREEQRALQAFDTQMIRSLNTVVVAPLSWLEWLGFLFKL